jgi:hypothetical protein
MANDIIERVSIDELPTFVHVTVATEYSGEIRYEYIRGDKGHPCLLGAYSGHGSRTPHRDGERAAAGQARRAMNASVERINKWRSRVVLPAAR